MRVLITGGAGFIGSHVTEALLARGHEVLVVDDLSTGHRANVPDGARFIELDLRVVSHLDEVFTAFVPEVVCHQAAQSSVAVSTREPVRDAEINIIGSVALMSSCVAHRVTRLVFASTGGAIYGEVPEGMRASEDRPPLPLSPYACAKLAVESYLRAFRHEHGLASTILRYANVYGPRQDPSGEAGVVAIFARHIQAGRPLQINARREQGDDGCIRDYVHVSDVVRANIAAIEGRLSDPLMNVCTGVATSTRALATQLARHLGAYDLRPGPHRPGDVERAVLDPSRFEAAIGTPMALGEGLAETLRWFAGN